MSSAGTIVKKRQIIGLDILRFTAALLVMWYHMAYGSWTFDAHAYNQMGFDFSALHGLRPFAQFGWIGVEIFFVISGFVIAFTAESSSAGQFLESRILRLVPGAWVCATLTAIFLLALHTQGPILRLYLRSALFYPVSPYISAVYWTLWVEIAFYAVVLLLLLANKFHRIERAAIAFGCVSALFWLAWSVAHYIAPDSTAALSLNNFAFKRVTQLFLIEHGCFFAIGTLLWAELLHGTKTVRRIWIFLFGLAGVAQIAGEAMRLHTSNVYIPEAIWLLSLGAFVISVRWNDKFALLIGGSARTIRNLGLATYPLYLIHVPLGVWVLGTLRNYGLPWAAALPLAMLSMIALAIAITLYPERMLRKGLGRLGTRLPPLLDFPMVGSSFGRKQGLAQGENRAGQQHKAARHRGAGRTIGTP